MSRQLPILVAAALPVLLAALPARAQTHGTITVVVVDTIGFSSDDLFELQYGIEQIVSDFGEFDLVPQSDLQNLLSDADQSDLTRCGTDPDCISRVLRPAGIDYALVVEAVPGQDGYNANIRAVDLATRRIQSEQEGNFPDPGNSLFLLAPSNEALEALLPSQGSQSNGGPVAEHGHGQEHGHPAVSLPPPQRRPNVLATSLIVGGGVVVALGLAFWIMADDTQATIQSGPHDRARLSDLQDTGSSQATIGNVGVVVGTLALATGIVFQLTGIGAPHSGFGGGDEDEDDWGARLQLGGHGTMPYVGIEVQLP